MTITVNAHDIDVMLVNKMARKRASLRLVPEGCSPLSNTVTLFVDEHVAAAIKAAFDRAKQVKFTSDTEARYEAGGHVWDLYFDQPGRISYQSQEFTGDGDPLYLSGDIKATGNLSADIGKLMDEIDAEVEENSCSRCAAFVGDENLTEIDDPKHVSHFLCEDCLEDDSRTGDA